ncbi:uncharacterized protein LOC114875605 [Osmia bicornis bicornis]|uniref:uncharacterized protein LOC114875605 n=1 Tax=Osmia bicornis bicornis TaxID=1437191 RepID=UPI0010FA47A7|nr:uncharacterized protein LOC114875605 [Osmia bicornis bicornis]XP_046143572.1 uncharacterized protein LOC114875605 [Osmia bicornis bicornis]
MIEMIFLVLFVGSLGASAAPGTSFLAENLEEKEMPLSKLVVDKPFLLPGGLNLLEKSQVPAKLPGTRNLEEKRIPELVLQKLAQPPREIHQED